jgi:transcriptional regulator with XRE-family HTH domain
MSTNAGRTRISGQKVRERRYAKGLSTTRLAVLLDRSPYTINQWERDLIAPPTKVLGDLANVLGCSVSDFFVPVEDSGIEDGSTEDRSESVMVT